MSGGTSATSHPLATSAALTMYAHGGNAIDAAIAAAFVLFVVEPDMSHIAGQAHILVFTQGDAACTHIDAYSVAPQAAHSAIYEWEEAPTQGNYRYRTKGDRNTTGALSVAVPATLVGLERLYGLGASLPWADLLRPAVELAEYGFDISLSLAQSLETEWARFSGLEEFARVFGRDGRPLQTGDRLVQTDLADTLRIIASEGSSALYQGVLAEAILDELVSMGSIISATDLRSLPNQVSCNRPVHGSYFGYDIYAAGTSTTGGNMLCVMLHEHEALLRKGELPSTLARLQAMREGFSKRLELISRMSHLDFGTPETKCVGDTGASGWNQENNTTHHSHMDTAGNAVALTQSIGDAFGSGVIVKDTGILLNNAMKLFDPRPDRPSSVYPGRKAISTMTPTILTTGGVPVLTLGSPSGTRIVNAVFQTLANLITDSLNFQEAVEAPRFHWNGDELEVEEDHPALQLLASKAPIATMYPACHPWFGVVQVVGHEDLRLSTPLLAFTDPRRPSASGALAGGYQLSIHTPRWRSSAKKVK